MYPTQAWSEHDTDNGTAADTTYLMIYLNPLNLMLAVVMTYCLKNDK